MRFPLTLLPVLLSTTLVAQAPDAADRERLLSRALNAAQAARIRAANSCPVRFFVDRQPQGAMILTNTKQATHTGQGLGITVSNSLKPIVSADIVAYGYSAGAHVIPAVPSSPREISETLHLTVSAGHPLIDYTIWAERLAMVNRIELTRIEHADGTTWQPSSESHCSASPSLLVLVDSVAQ